jgi:hypothetical protein
VMGSGVAALRRRIVLVIADVGGVGEGQAHDDVLSTKSETVRESREARVECPEGDRWWAGMKFCYGSAAGK